MLNENGIVIKIEGTTAWVSTHSQLACTSCQVETTCGTGILERYLAGKVFVSEIENSLFAEVCILRIRGLIVEVSRMLREQFFSDFCCPGDKAENYCVLPECTLWTISRRDVKGSKGT